MAHVACGKLDVYYEDGYGGPWDVAAGIIIVKEAGGVVCLPEGGEYTLVMGKGTLSNLLSTRSLVPITSCLRPGFVFDCWCAVVVCTMCPGRQDHVRAQGRV